MVIDSGHGGKDFGYTNGDLVEKNVNLSIGLKLAHMLKKRGYGVYLTRTGDDFISLDERARYTNIHHVDALVSIHTNASHVKSASGIETFYTANKGFLKEKTTMDPVEQKILTQCNEILEGDRKELAQLVHQYVLQEIQRFYPVRDRKIRSANAQVLFGPEVPSILIELGFLTHAQEGELLRTNNYQTILAQGICKGIEAYFA